MADLKSKGAIYLKGFLFLLMILIAGIWLVFETSLWKRSVLVLVLVWSSARCYYFMFYVIEKYVDPTFRFSGIIDFVRYLTTRKP